MSWFTEHRIVLANWNSVYYSWKPGHCCWCQEANCHNRVLLQCFSEKMARLWSHFVTSNLNGAFSSVWFKSNLNVSCGSMNLLSCKINFKSFAGFWFFTATSFLIRPTAAGSTSAPGQRLEFSLGRSSQDTITPFKHTPVPRDSVERCFWNVAGDHTSLKRANAT